MSSDTTVATAVRAAFITEARVTPRVVIHVAIVKFYSGLLVGVLNAVAAFVFGFVEGLVGLGEEIGEGWGFGAAESGYTDACGHRERLIVDGEFLLFQLFADAFEGDDAVVALYVGDDFQKFFAAVASADVGLAGIGF